ncbi:MAG: dihydrofolate reductase [bacterium]|nr:dihydrofolate reductase [bacterium]
MLPKYNRGDNAYNMDKEPRISIVVAVSRQNAIGIGNDLLFRISDDLKRFKQLTKGHPIVMGRKTYESIGRPLPERTNIIITRNPDYKAEGCMVVSSLEEAIKTGGEIALRLAPNKIEGQAQGDYKNSEVFVIGGGEIFKQAMPLIDKLYLTLVESDAEGDVFFPDWRKDFTKETFREERFDEKTGLRYTWVDLERR